MLDGVAIDDTELFNDRLRNRRNFYNYNRPHGGLDRQIRPGTEESRRFSNVV